MSILPLFDNQDSLSEHEQATLAECEQVIERGLGTFVEVGQALLNIRDERLYRRDFATFEDYCEERWNIKRAHAYRLIAASEVVANLSPIGDTPLPKNEGQARALGQFPADLHPAIMQTAVARYEAPTASEIERVGRVVTEMATTGHVDIANGTSTPIDAALTFEDEEAVKRAQVYVAENGRHKPKMNHAGDLYIPQGVDACQTPPEGLEPLLPYVYHDWEVWEPAAGQGLLVQSLQAAGLHIVYAGDLLSGMNFFEYEPEEWDCIITNPPYSIKYEWLEHCYRLGKPFALLMPVEVLGAKKAQALFRQYGVEVVFPNGRINFSMPNIGFEGSAAQFPTAWFTWGFNIGQGMTFSEMPR